MNISKRGEKILYEFLARNTLGTGCIIMNQKCDDRDLLYEILKELDLNTNLETQKVTVNKDYGKLEIDLISGAVYFIANLCLDCNQICGNKEQKICIILASSHYSGWANIPLRRADLLLLSKIIALENEYLPKLIANQCKKYKQCPPENLNQTLMYELNLFFQSKRRINEHKV